MAEPKRKGVSRARVIDLKYDQFRLGTTPYAQLAQSFMLFDHTGRKRVKKGNWVANRTAVAEDRKGRILVFVSEGGLTIWDFARLLQSSGLNLVKAMSMDGGYESELAVHTGNFDYVSYGQWETNDYGDLSLPASTCRYPRSSRPIRAEAFARNRLRLAVSLHLQYRYACPAVGGWLSADLLLAFLAPVVNSFLVLGSSFLVSLCLGGESELTLAFLASWRFAPDSLVGVSGGLLDHSTSSTLVTSGISCFRVRSTPM